MKPLTRLTAFLTGSATAPGFELIGPEYLELAYRTARQADPHAKLTYNEYGIENESEADRTKRAATLDLLKRLKAANVPIDALGIQSHISAGSGQTWGKGLRDLIAGAQSLGLEVYLTELDVNDDAVLGDDTAARDQQSWPPSIATISPSRSKIKPSNPSSPGESPIALLAQ